MNENLIEIQKPRQPSLPLPPSVEEDEDGKFRLVDFRRSEDEDEDDEPVMQLDASGKVIKRKISTGAAKNPGGRPPNPTGPLDKQIIIEVPTDLHLAYKKLCADRKVSMSSAIRDWIEGEVAKGISATEIRKRRMEAALEEYKRLGGSKLEQMLALFREMEKIQEIEELVNAE